MNDRYLKTIVAKAIKQADMGAMPGEPAYRNRGLTWHRLTMNQIHGLPEMAARIFQGQMHRFKEEYGKFMTNAKTGKVVSDFSAMIFTVYAEDRLLNNAVQKALPQRPELQHTADFVDNYEIRLPPNDPNKGIGSDWWFSHFGYAYGIRPSHLIEDQAGGPRQRAMPAAFQPYSSTDDRKQLPHGRIVIGPTGKGFGLFLSTTNNATINGQESPAGTMMPVFVGQSDEGFKKFVFPLLYNKTLLIAPLGPGGPIRPGKRTKRKDQRISEHGYDAGYDPNSKWIFGIDSEDGTFTMFQGRDESGQKINDTPLSRQQIESLVPRQVLQTEWTFRPAAGEVGEMGYSAGPYQLTEEQKQEIRNSQEYWGVPRLLEYRNFCEQVRGEELHTPFEGFKIITVGPINSSTALQEQHPDVTKTIAPMANPMHKKDPGQLSDYPDVARGIKWLVLENECSSTRMEGQDKNRLNPSKGAGSCGIHTEVYETPQEAMTHLTSHYGVPENVINAGMRSLEYADRALRAAMSAGTPQPSLPATPTPMPPQQLPPAGPQDVNGPNNTFASLKNLIRKKIGG